MTCIDLFQKVLMSDPQSGDLAGGAVAIHNDLAIVGAGLGDGTNTNQGAAYIFHKSDTVWLFEAKLTASDGAGTDRFGGPTALPAFGNAVNIFGNTAIVGATFRDSDATNNIGAAYIFTRSDDGTWTQTQELFASDPVAGAHFGRSVAINDQFAVIGNDDDDISPAVAHIFQKSDSIWSFTQQITPSDGVVNIGEWQIAIDNTTIIAGAADANSAYVFTYDGSTWLEQAKLTPSDGGTNFGASVDIACDYAVVGDQLGNAAYVFKRSDTTWTQQQKLIVTGGNATSVTIDGCFIAAGSQNNNSSQGQAFLYERSGSTWTLQSDVITPSDGTSNNFGKAVALSYPNLIVGAPGFNSSTGAAYFYHIDCANCCVKLSDLHASPICANSFLDVFFDLQFDDAHVTLSFNGSDYASDFTMGTDRSFHIQAPSISSDYVGIMRAIGISNRCCSDVQNVTVIVNSAVSNLAIAVSPSNTVCAGTPVTLTASGAQSYVWFDGSSDNPLIFTPTESSDYGVTGSSDLCSSDASVFITVKTRPVVAVSADSDTVCSGNAVTLTASGAQSYVWFDGSSDNPLTFIPTESSDYTVTGTSDGCNSDTIVHITVKQRPVVTIGASATVVCSDKSVTLTASGAQSYVWFDGSSDNPLTFTPTESSDYTVTGFSDGCSSDAIVHIIVKTPVTIDAGPDRMIPTGSTTVLGVGSALSDVQYTWSPVDGISDINAFPTTATPPSDLTYTVVAQRTDVSDCATSDSVTIHVCELLLSDIHFYAFGGDIFQVQGYQFADEPGTRFVSAQYLNAPIQIKSFDSDGPFLFAFNDTPISDGALVTIAAYRSDCASDVATVVSNKTQIDGTVFLSFFGSLLNFTLTLPPELSVTIPNNSNVHDVFSDICAYADAIDCQRFLAGLVINDSSDVFCSDAVILQNPEVVVVTCSDNVLNLDDLDQRFTFSITNFMSDSVFIQYSDTSCQITHTMNLSDGNFSFQNSNVNFRWVSPCLSDSLNVYTNIFSHPLLIIDAEGSIADVDLIDCVCPCHNPTSDLLYTATLRDTAIKFGEYLEAHYSDYPSLVSDQCHVLYQGPIIAGVVRLDFNTRTLLYHDLYIPLSDVNICS